MPIVRNCSNKKRSGNRADDWLFWSITAEAVVADFAHVRRDGSQCLSPVSATSSALSSWWWCSTDRGVFFDDLNYVVTIHSASRLVQDDLFSDSAGASYWWYIANYPLLTDNSFGAAAGAFLDDHLRSFGSSTWAA